MLCWYLRCHGREGTLCKGCSRELIDKSSSEQNTQISCPTKKMVNNLTCCLTSKIFRNMSSPVSQKVTDQFRDEGVDRLKLLQATDTFKCVCHKLCGILTFLQYTLYYIHITCLWPDLSLNGQRGKGWCCRQEGCQASDKTLFQNMQQKMIFLMRSLDISCCVSSDKTMWF